MLFPLHSLYRHLLLERADQLFLLPFLLPPWLVPLTFSPLKELTLGTQVPAHRATPRSLPTQPSRGWGARGMSMLPEASPPRNNNLFLALCPTPTLEQ